MTEDEWIETYKPIAVPNSNEGFDFGEGCTLRNWHDSHHIKAVENANPNCVWTVLDNGEVTAIAAGLHHVNRLGYIITSMPWSDPGLEIILDE